MKVKVRCGRVRRHVEEDGPGDEADGENLGIVKFGPEGAAELVAHHGPPDRRRRRCATGRRGPSREFAQARPLHAIGTRGFPWIEIDFPEDYQRAVRDDPAAIDGDADDATSTRRCRCVAPVAHVDAGASLPTALRFVMVPVRPAPSDARQDVASSHERCRASSRSAAAPVCPTCCAACVRCSAARRADDTDAGARSPRRDRRDLGRWRKLGKLRAEFNMIPPGDIRNCLAALSDNHSLSPTSSSTGSAPATA